MFAIDFAEFAVLDRSLVWNTNVPSIKWIIILRCDQSASPQSMFLTALLCTLVRRRCSAVCCQEIKGEFAKENFRNGLGRMQ